MVTFVAIENPSGLLGLKRRGVITAANPVGDPTFLGKQHSTHPTTYKEGVYAERDAYFRDRKPDWVRGKNLAEDLIHDTNDNVNTVVKLTKMVQTHPDMRVLMCSSVESLTKYILNYIATNVGTQIDTLIIYGHGGADSMNVGLGRIGGAGLSALQDARDDEDEEQEAKVMTMRKMAGMEPRPDSRQHKPARTREISVDNKDRWLAAMQGLAPHVTTRANTGCFHLFLMACSIGEETGKPSHKSLVNVAAKALRGVLPESVAVAAPTDTVTDDELFTMIKSLATVCEAVVDDNAFADKVKLVTCLET
jgi:hypothetical protein